MESYGAYHPPAYAGPLTSAGTRPHRPTRITRRSRTGGGIEFQHLVLANLKEPRKATVRCLAVLRMTFERQGSRLMGRKSLKQAGLLVLGSGFTTAIFQLSGKTPLVIEWLIMVVMACKDCGKAQTLGNRSAKYAVDICVRSQLKRRGTIRLPNIDATAPCPGVPPQHPPTLLAIFQIRLFEENEDLLHLFEKFRHLNPEEQVSSAELAEHATKVMHTLDEGIKGLGDVDAFFAYVRHVGATHHQVPGFKSDNFWKIEQPFLQAAKTTLGERYTPNIENIYKLTIRFILENLVKGYDESGKENGNGQT